MEKKFKILIAEDHGKVRDGIKMIVAAQADMEIVGEASDGRAAVELARELAPDIVLMDISMPKLNGLKAAAQLKRVAPNVADDDDDSRAMLKILLEMRHYRVIEAKDGVEAIRLAENSRPDLILMDVKMPRLNGFETARAIRRSAKNFDVPIIFLSACAEKIYRDQTAAASKRLPRQTARL